MDDDSTDILDSVDRRLDPLVPTGPAPVTDLVRRGRARRTRRRGLQAGLVTAFAVAVAATTTAVVDGRDAAPSPPPPVASTPTPTPTPTRAVDGTRTIGLDGLAVDVPADWVATGVRLEEPIDGDVRGTCNTSGVAVGSPSTAGNCTSTTYVEMDRLDVSFRQGGEPMTRQGLDLRRRDDVCPVGTTCEHGDAWTTVWVEGEPLGAVIVTPGDDALLERIVASIRPVPDGQVAVPHVDGEYVEGATYFLEEAGLVVPAPPADFVVGYTVPGAGSVVPVGSEVELEPIPGS